MNRIQIHHDGNLHWVYSKNTTEGTFLFDSYYSRITNFSPIAWFNKEEVTNVALDSGKVIELFVATSV